MIGIINVAFVSPDLFTEPSETSELAKSASADEGVYFVPAFFGLQAPFSDPSAGAGFIGNKTKLTFGS